MSLQQLTNLRDPTQLWAVKMALFDRMQVEARPGVKIPYLEGIKGSSHAYVPGTPHEKQRKLHFDDLEARYTILSGGQRSGKTIWLAAEHLPILAFPNTRAWVVAPNYDLGDKLFEYIWEWCIRQRVLGENSVDGASTFTRDKKLFKTTWNSFVVVKSAENRDSLRAEQLDHLSLDEAAMIAEKIWQRDLRPRLANRRGSANIGSSPMGISSWFRRYLDKAQEPEWQKLGWRSMTMGQIDNPFIDPQEIEEQRAMLPHEVFLQEVCGIPQHYAGMVFPNYRDQLYPNGHVYEPSWVDIGVGCQGRGIDIGIKNPTACIWAAVMPEGYEFGPIVTNEGDIFVWQDYEEVKGSHEEHAQEIESLSPRRIAYSYISHDAKRRVGATRNDRQNALSVYRRNGVYARPVAPGPEMVQAGVGAVNRYLSSTLDPSTAAPRIFISRGAARLRERILEYVYEELGHNPSERDGPERPLKRRDHLPDALRYFVSQEPRFIRDSVLKPSLLDREVEGSGNYLGVPGLSTIPWPEQVNA